MDELEPHQVALLVLYPKPELAKAFLDVPALIATPDKDITIAVIQPAELLQKLREHPAMEVAIAFSSIMAQSLYRASVISAETLEQAAEAERYIVGLSRGLAFLDKQTPGITDLVRQRILAQETAKS